MSRKDRQLRECKAVLHSYRLTRVDKPEEVGLGVGQEIVDSNHVPAYCEPYRVWTYIDTESWTTWDMVGKHLGEFEKGSV